MARHDLPTNRKKELKKTFQKCFPTVIFFRIYRCKVFFLSLYFCFLLLTIAQRLSRHEKSFLAMYSKFQAASRQCDCLKRNKFAHFVSLCGKDCSSAAANPVLRLSFSRCCLLLLRRGCFVGQSHIGHLHIAKNG